MCAGDLGSQKRASESLKLAFQLTLSLKPPRGCWELSWGLQEDYKLSSAEPFLQPLLPSCHNSFSPDGGLCCHGFKLSQVQGSLPPPSFPAPAGFRCLYPRLCFYFLPVGPGATLGKTDSALYLQTLHPLLSLSVLVVLPANSGL